MPTDIQKQTTIAPGATGIAEDKAVGGIKIYPNPSKGKFTMQIADRHLLKGSCNIEIYTVLGEKIILKFSPKPGEIKIRKNQQQINQKQDVGNQYNRTVRGKPFRHPGNDSAKGKKSILCIEPEMEE